MYIGTHDLPGMQPSNFGHSSQVLQYTSACVFTAITCTLCNSTPEFGSRKQLIGGIQWSII